MPAHFQIEGRGFRALVEIETMVDGGEGSLTATRTVVLGFDRSDKAKVLKSKIEFKVKKPEDE